MRRTHCQAGSLAVPAGGPPGAPGPAEGEPEPRRGLEFEVQVAKLARGHRDQRPGRSDSGRVTARVERQLLSSLASYPGPPGPARPGQLLGYRDAAGVKGHQARIMITLVTASAAAAASLSARTVHCQCQCY
jgi:hypothetical protein